MSEVQQAADPLIIDVWLPQVDRDLVETDCANCGAALGPCPVDRDWLCDRCYAEEMTVFQDKSGEDMATIDHFKKAAHEIGDLFCWCVQNLKKFPPMEGEWLDEVKRRLLLADAKAAEVDSHDALLAACKAAKKELNCLIDQATHRGYSSGGPKRIVEQLTAAIAAAEGRGR